MLPEITDYAGLLALLATGLTLAVLATSVTERIPVPAPALFLVGAAIASDVWPQVYAHVPIMTVERIAVVALIIILLNGGMDIGATRFRRSLRPILSIGILGTFLTAGATAVFAHVALGFDWKLAGVVGAAIAPTDPAVMFSVLGRREIGGRSGTVLEGEAGVNDPAGIALLLGMVEVATHADASVVVVLREFVVEIGIGTACGLAGGFALIPLLRRVRLGSSSLYPVIALSLAVALYATTTLLHGSGFSAVFFAGLVLGDAGIPYREEIDRFVAGLASLAELVVFIALGLTVRLTDISGGDWVGGIALTVALALLIRPAVVILTLLRSGLGRRERAFIAWSGLKGAVPILLAAFALLGDVPDGRRVYQVVFVVVLVSVVGQGTFVPLVARRLGIPMTLRPPLPWELSVRLAEPPSQHVELLVQSGSWADDRRLGDLPLGERGWVTLIVRDDVAVPAHPDTPLRAGDLVLALGIETPVDLEDRFAGP